MEALCSRTSAESDDTIITCLKSVQTLLTSKREGVVSPAVSREILAVIHRLMLTRDCSEIRNLSVTVLEQLVLAAKTNTQCKYGLVQVLMIFCETKELDRRRVNEALYCIFTCPKFKIYLYYLYSFIGKRKLRTKGLMRVLNIIIAKVM